MKKILLLSFFWLSSLQAGICGSKPKRTTIDLVYYSNSTMQYLVKTVPLSVIVDGVSVLNPALDGYDPDVQTNEQVAKDLQAYKDFLNYR